MAKELIWSEESDFVYGRAVEFESKDDFIKTVIDQYEDGLIKVDDVQIQTCIYSEKPIPADHLVPLTTADVVIENYYTASIVKLD